MNGSREKRRWDTAATPLSNLDWCVGELMKTLDRLKLTENTLVVFCSDNGPVLDDGYKDGAIEKIGNHRPAGPYSGGKYSVYEGGTRTPFITRWKGRIEPGVSDEMVCTIDLAGQPGCFDRPNRRGRLRRQPNVLGPCSGKPGAKAAIISSSRTTAPAAPMD